MFAASREVSPLPMHAAVRKPRDGVKLERRPPPDAIAFERAA